MAHECVDMCMHGVLFNVLILSEIYQLYSVIVLLVQEDAQQRTSSFRRVQQGGKSNFRIHQFHISRLDVRPRYWRFVALSIFYEIKILGIRHLNNSTPYINCMRVMCKGTCDVSTYSIRHVELLYLRTNLLTHLCACWCARLLFSSW